MKITTTKYKIKNIEYITQNVIIYFTSKNFLKEIEYIEQQDFKKGVEHNKYFTFIIDKNV